MGVRVARVLDLVNAPALSCIVLTDFYRDTPNHGLEVPDVQWIEDASSEGWLVLTQDQKILQRAQERGAILRHNAGVVILRPGNAVNYDVLSFVIRRMSWLRRIDSQPRPFVYRTPVLGRAKQIDLEALS